MSNNGDLPNPMDAFTKMWTDFASQMAQAGMSLDPAQQQPDAARAMRDTMLGAMNRHAQEFMRSPEFLNTMKQAFDGSMAARKQLNDFLAQAQHDFQATSRDDIDQVMQAIQSLESRLTSGMDRLGQHIDRVNARLDALESMPPTEKTARKKSIRKKAAKKKAPKKKASKKKRAAR